MPAQQTERAIGLRKFDGVNQQLDSVYLGPSILRRATNWVPAESYVLRKRYGTLAFLTIADTARIDRVQRAYDTAELNRYLYAARTPTLGTDDLQVSVNDAAFAAVTNGAFASTAQGYDMVQIGNLLYVGNGVDPLKRIPLGGAAVDLVGLTAFTDGSAAPTLAADTGATLLSGTYSYGWAVLNHTTGVWTYRSQAREVTKSAATAQSVSFPVATGYTLGPNERFHLFVAPVNLPIELSSDQFPEGVTGGGLTSPVVLRDVQVSRVFWPLRGTARTGNQFAPHRQRLYFAGWATDPTLVCATSVIQPQAEQQLFNQFDFFPVNAVLKLPGTVTGLAVAAIDAGTTQETQTPQAPLAIFLRTRTYLFFGDLVGDDSATLTQVSGRVGCSAHRAIVQTPYGLVWPGLESVYLMPPGGGAPQDIGWPIAPAIKAVDASRRRAMRAIFHKGFVKLAFSSPGRIVNDQVWWLDLRLGGVGQTPRWFGPHTGAFPTAMTVGLLDPNELDRGFLAVEGTGVVLRDDVPGSHVDHATPITAVLETGELDDGAPFDQKLWSRIRLTMQSEIATDVQVQLEDEHGTVTVLAPLAVEANTVGMGWNTGLWDSGTWGVSTARFRETQATTPANRPASLRTTVTLQHAGATTISLRDVEVRYHPVQRPTRSPDRPPRA